MREIDIRTRVMAPNDHLTRIIAKVRLFYLSVRSGGPLDYKSRNPYKVSPEMPFKFYDRYLNAESFGNVAFGSYARLVGFSEEEALMGAGLYSIFGQGSLHLNNIRGWGDAPEDTQNVRYGYENVRP
jgi:hypothetical protein